MIKIKNLLVGAAVVALPLSLAALPASADADGVITGPPGGPLVETVKVKDAGNVEYTLSVQWNYKYVDAAGNTRVSVNPLKVVRPDATTVADDDGVDLHFDVRQGTSTVNFQHKVYDGIDLDDAADDQASFNPKNPRSDAGATNVRVKVGTDADGLGNSRWVTFYQPAGLDTRTV